MTMTQDPVILARALRIACTFESRCPTSRFAPRWPGCLNDQEGPGCPGTLENDAECWERFCIELAQNEETPK